ncbi:hypothetical protein, partial [Legionella erythra]|uniref:hypothetical protein n=1 Tax=Legionella erythra TaxID=448 RepID=UPI001A94E4F8
SSGGLSPCMSCPRRRAPICLRADELRDNDRKMAQWPDYPRYPSSGILMDARLRGQDKGVHEANL